MRRIVFGTLALYPSWSIYTNLHDVGTRSCTEIVAMVSNMSLEAFRCEEHPNDKRSLTNDRSVICWEGSDSNDIQLTMHVY